MWLGDLGVERREWRDPRSGRTWIVARDPEQAPGTLRFVELGEDVLEMLEVSVGSGVELMRLPDERMEELLDQAR